MPRWLVIFTLAGFLATLGASLYLAKKGAAKAASKARQYVLPAFASALLLAIGSFVGVKLAVRPDVPVPHVAPSSQVAQPLPVVDTVFLPAANAPGDSSSAATRAAEPREHLTAWERGAIQQIIRIAFWFVVLRVFVYAVDVVFRNFLQWREQVRRRRMP